MAISTLANSPNPHRLIADIVRPFAPSNHPKPQPEFRVFPTGEAKYPWHIRVLAVNRSVSLHKNLSFALKKCTRLNKQRGKGARNETN